ncbi:MAG: hypothetical protein WCL71_15705 [Deltaproteobacteria bacterium]
MTDKWFAAKIAVFNAGGFSLCVAAITYVDARLTTHVVFGAKIYPHGYLVAILGGIVILALTVLTFFKRSSWAAKTGLPSVIVSLVGAFSIPFFRPELPHAALLEGVILISVVSLLTCYIRFSPITKDWLTAYEIAEAARIERVKEYANLWRTIAVSSVFGVIALIVPWSQFVWKMPEYIVTTSNEAFLLGQFGVGGIVVICIYALLGVVYESFHKAKIAADLLLFIKKSRP